MTPEERREGQRVARNIIRRLDEDGKYIPTANYELEGRRLREALEAAWFEGYRKRFEVKA